VRGVRDGGGPIEREHGRELFLKSDETVGKQPGGVFPEREGGRNTAPSECAGEETMAFCVLATTFTGVTEKNAASVAKNRFVMRKSGGDPLE